MPSNGRRPRSPKARGGQGGTKPKAREGDGGKSFLEASQAAQKWLQDIEIAQAAAELDPDSKAEFYTIGLLEKIQSELKQHAQAIRAMRDQLTAASNAIGHASSNFPNSHTEALERTESFLFFVCNAVDPLKAQFGQNLDLFEIRKEVSSKWPTAKAVILKIPGPTIGQINKLSVAIERERVQLQTQYDAAKNSGRACASCGGPLGASDIDDDEGWCHGCRSPHGKLAEIWIDVQKRMGFRGKLARQIRDEWLKLVGWKPGQPIPDDETILKELEAWLRTRGHAPEQLGEATAKALEQARILEFLRQAVVSTKEIQPASKATVAVRTIGELIEAARNYPTGEMVVPATATPGLRATDHPWFKSLEFIYASSERFDGTRYDRLRRLHAEVVLSLGVPRWKTLLMTLEEFADLMKKATAPTNGAPAGMLTYGELAIKHDLEPDLLRKALATWQMDHDSGYIEVTNRKPRQQKFLYDEEAVLPVIAEQKARQRTSSEKKPARKSPK
jgi:hypothetical protein